MKLIFHERYYNSQYANDPAAEPGRLESIMKTVSGQKKDYEVITPKPAQEDDILRAHTRNHLDGIKTDPLLYELASLAAGGAIRAADEAYQGNPAFAVIRPPGHHASADSCWGFCYFNNLSISLLKLYSEGKIRSAFILDFDLHTGDGNINILTQGDDDFRVAILNPTSHFRTDYLTEVEEFMRNLDDIGIFAASAGFDQGINDWGGLLIAEDYINLGRLMKEYAQKLCQGRRYAIFEGGYYHPDLGTHVDAFCQGFR